MEEKKENLYYTKPSDKEFQEMQEKAIELFEEFSLEWEKNKYYLEEKTKSINKLTNFKANFMDILTMFNEYKQELLLNKLSIKTRAAALKRRFSVLGENQ